MFHSISRLPVRRSFIWWLTIDIDSALEPYEPACDLSVDTIYRWTRAVNVAMVSFKGPSQPPKPSGA